MPADARKLDRSQHRLLVVSSDPAGRQATVRQLQSAGFPVSEAGSGTEALALADASLSAVVLDIHLPDIDGLEVCRRLRRQPATFGLPVIQLAPAGLSDEGKLRSLDAGADACLTHPAEPAALVALIQALLRTRAAEDAMCRSDDLIAVLSHELRTPLNVILNWAHMLRKRSQPELLERGLAAIERNAEIQARLISDVLDMSRMNLGKLPLNREWVAAGSLVAAAAAAVQPLLERSRHSLRLDLADEEVKLYADGSRIQQVLWNLIGNAVKFSPAGSEVMLTLRAADEGVAITVADQGQGIPADFLPFVFDRFAQSDAASKRHHGSLGLAIVKHLVESHGGQVSAASAGPGQGAQFTLWLPADPATTDLRAGFS